MRRACATTVTSAPRSPRARPAPDPGPARLRDAVGLVGRDRRVVGRHERRHRRAHPDGCRADRRVERRGRCGDPHARITGRAARALPRARGRARALQHPAGLSRGAQPIAIMILHLHAGVHAGLAGCSAHLADLAVIRVLHALVHAQSGTSPCTRRASTSSSRGVMPCMRIMARIIVLHMSAQFMHAGPHDIICVEHTVHACSQAEQASIQACITDMSIESIPGIDIMSFDIASIIIESISRSFFFSTGGGSRLLRTLLRPMARVTGARAPSASIHTRVIRSDERATRAEVGRTLVRMPETTPRPRSLARLVAAAAAALLLSAGGLLSPRRRARTTSWSPRDPAADSTIVGASRSADAHLQRVRLDRAGRQRDRR